MHSDKKIFLEACQEHNIPVDNAERAWEKLAFLKQYIRKHWNKCKDMQHYSKKERLKLRENAAEIGMEITPNDLDRLIEILGRVQDGINEWEIE